MATKRQLNGNETATGRLIIHPLAKMAKIVENLSLNPLAKIDESVEVCVCSGVLCASTPNPKP
jgi:hypothetical protein